MGPPRPYFFFVVPWPGFGTRSTVVVDGRCRASLTGMKWPVPESRPRRTFLLPFDMASLHCRTLARRQPVVHAFRVRGDACIPAFAGRPRQNPGDGVPLRERRGSTPAPFSIPNHYAALFQSLSSKHSSISAFSRSSISLRRATSSLMPALSCVYSR